MNAAFAIGRLCDIAKGRTMLLTMPEAGRMVTHLGEGYELAGNAFR